MLFTNSRDFNNLRNFNKIDVNVMKIFAFLALVIISKKIFRTTIFYPRKSSYLDVLLTKSVLRNFVKI